MTPADAAVVPIESHPSHSNYAAKRSSPTSATRRRRSATTNPDDMRPPFDAVIELALNRDKYTGSSWVSINALPGHLRTCLERLCTAVVDLDIGEVVANDDGETAGSAASAESGGITKGGLIKRPGVSPAAAVCIAHGVQTIREHPDVVAMLELRDTLHRIKDGRNANMAEEIAGWLSQFKMSIPNYTTTEVRSLNVPAANWLRVELNDGAENLGISASQMAVLAIGVTLADQPSTLDERRRQLTDIAGQFYERVQIRCAVGRALLARLHQGEV